MILWGFLGFVGLAMLAGGVAVLYPRWSGSDEILFTLMLTGLYALGGMLVVTFGKRMRVTQKLCLLGLMLSLSFFIFAIWFEQALQWKWENRVWVSGAVSLTIAGGLAHRLFIWPIKSSSLSGAWFKWAAIVFAVTTTGFILYGFLSEGFGYWGRGYIRLIWVNLILVTGTTIATGAIALFGPQPGDDEPGLLATSIPIVVTCPRCQSQVDAQSNRETRCSNCRLKVRVEVEEPRCGCGYLLYGLASNQCPECGEPVPDADRWNADSTVLG